MRKINGLKNAMKRSSKTVAMILPYARIEIHVDPDGDRKADFAFIDGKKNNGIDTFAIDTTNDGEYNLSLTDLDDNRLADHILYCEGGAEEPKLSYIGAKVEAVLTDAIERFTQALRQNNKAPVLKEPLLT